MEPPSIRQVYGVFEQRITPVVETVVHSEQFGDATAVVGKLRKFIGKSIENTTTDLLHLANLPAGSDIKRLRRQIGALDYEVRKLRLELAAREAARDVEKPGEPKPGKGSAHDGA